jgi:hypothetical protein
VRTAVRIVSHRDKRTGMVNCRRRMRFHSDPRFVCLLGARYPLASLFSSLDVHRDDWVVSSQKLMGVFLWVLSGWAVGLRKHLCDYVLG